VDPESSWPYRPGTLGRKGKGEGKILVENQVGKAEGRTSKKRKTRTMAFACAKRQKIRGDLLKKFLLRTAKKNRLKEKTAQTSGEWEGARGKGGRASCRNPLVPES